MADGAFAEYIIVPASSINKVPPGIPSDEAALVEPLSVGLHAVGKSGIRPGDNVWLWGRYDRAVDHAGARISGAKKVIVVEIIKARKKLATQLGADMVVDPTEVNVSEEVYKATNGLGQTLLLNVLESREH